MVHRLPPLKVKGRERRAERGAQPQYREIPEETTTQGRALHSLLLTRNKQLYKALINELLSDNQPCQNYSPD